MKSISLGFFIFNEQETLLMNNKEAIIINQNQEGLTRFGGLFKVINSLKAIAIFQMITWHCYHYFKFSPIQDNSNLIINSLIEIADFSGDTYVFLSGLILTLLLTQKNYETHSWKEWYKKRIVRIFPIFILATLGYVIYHTFVTGDIYSINSILIHMSGLQSLPTNNVFVFLLIEGSQWFITFILICYLLFPIIYYFLKKNFKLTVVAILSLYTIYLFFSHPIYLALKDGIFIIFQENLYSWQFGITTLRYFVFFFGMIIGYWIGNNPERSLRFLQNRKIGLISMISLMVLTIIYTIFQVWKYEFLDLARILYHPLLTILFFIFIFYVLGNNKRINNILRIPGEELYEIFLFHQLAKFLTAYILFDYFVLEKNIVLLWLLIPIIIIESIILANPFYRLDRYLRRKTKCHKIIVIISLSLIIYGIISVIFDYSKGALFNFSQDLININALILYLLILIIVIIFYILYFLIKKYQKKKKENPNMEENVYYRSIS